MQTIFDLLNLNSIALNKVLRTTVYHNMNDIVDNCKEYQWVDINRASTHLEMGCFEFIIYLFNDVIVLKNIHRTYMIHIYNNEFIFEAYKTNPYSKIKIRWAEIDGYRVISNI